MTVNIDVTTPAGITITIPPAGTVAIAISQVTVALTVPQVPAVQIVAGGMPGRSINPRGPWSAVVNYVEDDLVTSDGSSWLALSPSIGIDPGLDSSGNPIGSLTSTSPLALGSPTATATGFRVDRGSSVVAMSVAQCWPGAVPPGVTAGIASGINVPGVGVQWIAKGTPNPAGKVTLDGMAMLSPGTRYWFVLIGATGVQIDQIPDMSLSHTILTDEFWYGTGAPSNDFFGVYACPMILFGTSTDNPWQLFVEAGSDADVTEHEAKSDPHPQYATDVYVNARTPKITASTTAPSSPAVNDVWIDTN